MSYIFKKLHDYKLTVNLIQNSAISFSVCVDNKYGNFDAFYIELKNEFAIDFQKEVDLYTIRHFNEATKAAISQRGTTLLSQTNKETIQIVLQEYLNKKTVFLLGGLIGTYGIGNGERGIAGNWFRAFWVCGET